MIFWIIGIIAWLAAGFIAAIFAVDEDESFTEQVETSLVTIIAGPIMLVVVGLYCLALGSIQIRKHFMEKKENKHAEKRNNKDM